jgi:hypothetical protein
MPPKVDLSEAALVILVGLCPGLRAQEVVETIYGDCERRTAYRRLAAAVREGLIYVTRCDGTPAYRALSGCPRQRHYHVWLGNGSAANTTGG